MATQRSSFVVLNHLHAHTTFRTEMTVGGVTVKSKKISYDVVSHCLKIVEKATATV